MPGNDLARQIKEHLTARQVVELYGFHPDLSLIHISEPTRRS